mgnify:CR=1 FL=1
MEYIIIGIVLLIILLAVLKASKKDVSIDLNKLVEYLGGKDNIISTETDMSRFKVEYQPKPITVLPVIDVEKSEPVGIVHLTDLLSQGIV